MVCFLVWLFGHEPPTGGFASGDIVENSPELFFSTRRLVKKSPGLFRGNNPKGDRRLGRAEKMTTTWTTEDNSVKEKSCYMLSKLSFLFLYDNKRQGRTRSGQLKMREEGRGFRIFVLNCAS